jgi:dihydroorotate dehydrogenase
VQLYTGLVFRGLRLVGEIKSALLAALAQERANSLSSLVGIDAAKVTAQAWP